MMTDKALRAQTFNEAQLGHGERRLKPRVACSYPAAIRGQSEQGLPFEARAVLLNMSASGMYLRTNRRLAQGELVTLLVRLSTAPLNQGEAPQIMASGDIVRAQALPDGTYGVAVRLHNHRFL